MARVLIIDDDPVVARILVQAIRRLSHEAVAATTMAEGLRQAGAGETDAVFLDLVLPDGDGLEALPSLRALPSRPEVIILTATGSSDSAETAIRNGAWDYLQKPVAPKEIALILGRVVQYRQRLRQEPRVKALKTGGIVGGSPRMLACFDLLAQAAASEAGVLLSGETGTGKELFARAIHENSRRAGGELVVVDCASLPESLVAGILFGHEKGAFTGADKAREGLIRQADGGTLFLDEVGELPPGLQKTFLRVLDERSFRPIGSRREAASDFRLIAATNRDLAAECARGAFREDLYYRLRAITIELPPLRERPGDIKAIVLAHLARLCEKNGLPTKGLAPDFLDAVAAYSWPGNVRELIHALERAIISASGDDLLFAKHLPLQIRIATAKSALETPAGKRPAAPAPGPSTLATFRVHRDQALQAAERQYLRELMAAARGSMKEACRLSGLGRTRLYTLLKKHDISRLGWS
ncbi:MAG: sigma-54 dependent transcriptional regulator [Desulfobacteraceae bacterium]|nr:sigma-54 dependent transcriptional regulator [Desulfobacteraceae bacterium]